MCRKDIIEMSREELKRAHVVKRVMEGLKQREAAEMLGLSIRQIKRIVRRVRKEGDEGLAHRNRGRKSNRRLRDKQKEEVIELYRKKYSDFGPTLFCEKLEEKEGIRISDETARQWLLGSGDWEKRRSRDKHRQWRERRSCYGQMQQMDGSEHDWLEGRGPWMVLMGYIDDATGRVFGRFYQYEGTIPAMDSFKGYIRKYGLPQSVYLDRHTTYKSTRAATIEEELKGERPLSQFERALKDLGVKVIHAYSPQAKGRVERLFKTLQDRLVKEMRLAGIKTLEEANEFLKGYLPIYNRKFCVVAKEKADMHMKLRRGLDLDRILCIKTQRSVRNDFTVGHDARLYQILEKTKSKKVIVEEKINGTLQIYDNNKRLKYKEILNRPQKVKEVVRLSEFFTVPRKRPKVPLNHPWRRPFKPQQPVRPNAA